MFAEYLAAAMRHAVYEQIEDGTYFGTISGFQGAWANAPTQEECAKELESVIEEWILLAIVDHDELPDIDGHKLDERGLTDLQPVGDHEFMMRGQVRVSLPNPHQEDISQPLLERILKEAGISREEWEVL